MCPQMYVGWTEDQLWESVLSFYHRDPGIEPRSSALLASACWALLSRHPSLAMIPAQACCFGDGMWFLFLLCLAGRGCHLLSLLFSWVLSCCLVSGSFWWQRASTGFLQRVLKAIVRVNPDLLCGYFRFHRFMAVFKLFLVPFKDILSTPS